MSEIREIIRKVSSLSYETAGIGKFEIDTKLNWIMKDIDQAEQKIKDLMLSEEEIKDVFKVLHIDNFYAEYNREKIAKAIIQARKEKMNG